MKAIALAASLVLLGGPADAAPRSPGTGVGVVAGNPTGVTLKHWPDPSLAFDAGIGFSGDAAFYADFLWHSWDLFPPPSRGRLAAYAGLGPRLETERTAVLGLRTIAGAAYWLAGRPVEIFMEGGPVFRLAPGRGVDIDIGGGIRFYFGAAQKE